MTAYIDSDASNSQEDDVSVSYSQDDSTDDESELDTGFSVVPVTAPEDDVDIPDYESSHGSGYSEHSSIGSSDFGASPT